MPRAWPGKQMNWGIQGCYCRYPQTGHFPLWYPLWHRGMFSRDHSKHMTRSVRKRLGNKTPASFSLYAERSSWIKMPTSLCNSSYPHWNHQGNNMLDVWGLQNGCPIISLFCFVIMHVTFNCFHTLFTLQRKYHAEWLNCDFNTKPTNKKRVWDKSNNAGKDIPKC